MLASLSCSGVEWHRELSGHCQDWRAENREIWGHRCDSQLLALLGTLWAPFCWSKHFHPQLSTKISRKAFCMQVAGTHLRVLIPKFCYNAGEYAFLTRSQMLLVRGPHSESLRQGTTKADML